MAAVWAADGPAPVHVIERTADGGRKILISGGGRCNILPSALHPERFVTDSPPRLVRHLLRAWPLDAQRQFFEHMAGVPLALERETGKWFPSSNRARDVRDGLVALARRKGVTFHFQCTMTALTPAAHGWDVVTTTGTIRASRVVLASGGLSVPTTGSDGSGLHVAETLGHRVHPTYAALTPLTCDAPPPLSGVSLPVRLRARWDGRTLESTGGFLFTHRGYSGPSVLDVSHVCVRSLMAQTENAEERGTADASATTMAADHRATLRVNWAPEVTAAEWDARLRAGDRLVTGTIGSVLPERLTLHLIACAGVPRDRRTSALRREERTALVDLLTAFPLPWSGHESYRKAEVTGGGVALDEVDPQTLESRRHPGLHLCGEMLDAFGPIGGYNFAWAWSTGRAAGVAAAAAHSGPVTG